MASEVEELKTQIKNLQQDVESKASTVKHLQNALEAKSMTINILQKSNKDGGDVEKHINDMWEGKKQALLAAKDKEIEALQSELEEVYDQLNEKEDAAVISAASGMKVRRTLEQSESVQQQLEEVRIEVAKNELREKFEKEQAKMKRDMQDEFATKTAELEKKLKEQFAKDLVKVETEKFEQQKMSEEKIAEAQREVEKVKADLQKELDAATAKDLLQEEKIEKEQALREKIDKEASKYKEDIQKMQKEAVEFQRELDELRATQSNGDDAALQQKALREKIQKELDDALQEVSKLKSEANATGGVEVEQLKEKLAEEKKKLSETMTDLRKYQTSTIELSQGNEHLKNTVEEYEANMREMQEEHEGKVKELEEELAKLEKDKALHSSAVMESIDTRVVEMRENAEKEKQEVIEELKKSQESDQTRIKSLAEELDALRVKNDANEIELNMLREAVGDISKEDEGKADSSPSNSKEDDATKEARERKAVVKNLREQSQFAFDEMVKRITQVREEAEEDKKQVRSELESKVKVANAKVLALTNSNDKLLTQVDSLERERDTFKDERNQREKELTEKRKQLSSEEDKYEELQKDLDDVRKTNATHRFVSALRCGVVGPAFSLLRQSVNAKARLEGGDLAKDAIKETPSRLKLPVNDPEQDTSTVDGSDLCDDEEDDDDEDDEEEPTYGVDDQGNEEWVEMLRSNTLNAFFIGSGQVTDNIKDAGCDLQAEVGKVHQSLTFFPQFYAPILKACDPGHRRDLQKFIVKLQKVMDRIQRISTAVMELCERNEHLSDTLIEMVRMKSLEWNLGQLHQAAQQDVLIKLMRNYNEKLRTDYEDVLDQYGEECEKTANLQTKVEELEQQKGSSATSDLEHRASQEPKPSLIPQSAPQDLAEVKELMNSIERKSAAPAPPSGKGKGKAPPLPPGVGGAEVAANNDESEVAPAPKPKGKGKGAPPPLPWAKAEGAEAPAPAEAEAPPAPKPGKAKGKGAPPPLPWAKAESEAAPEAPAEAPKAKPGKGKGPPLPPGVGGAAEVSEEPAAAPKKGKGKGPPLPPGVGGAAEEAPKAGKGKGPPLPPGVGPAPPAPGGKGPPPPGGKGPPPPGGKGPAPPAGKGGPPPPGGKGPGPPGKGPPGKGGPGMFGKGKNAGPPVDPGPAPPPDLIPKKFHWQGVTGTRFPGSIFETLLNEKEAEKEESTETTEADTSPRKNRKPGKVKIHLDMLAKMFFQKKKDTSAADAEAAAKSGPKKKNATCLDGKRSQQVEIFLNGRGVTFDHVKSAVLELDQAAIATENLNEIVLNLMPNPEEVASLKEFKEANDPKVLPWGRAEEFMISLMELKDFKVRAECCVTQGVFAQEFDSVGQDITQFKKVLVKLMTSSGIKAVFSGIMQMGNFLNYGTNKGAQKGFSLDSLALLGRIDGFEDKSYTLLRFLADSLEHEGAILKDTFEDTELCDPVSKLDLDEALRKLGSLEKDVAKVIAVAAPVDGAAEGPSKLSDPKFEKLMRAFASSAEGKLSALRTEADEVVDMVKKVTDLYAEKPKTPLSEILVKFAAFRKDLKEAKQQNLLARAKKEKADKKRREEQAKAAKKAGAKAPAEKAGAKAPAEKAGAKAPAAKADPKATPKQPSAIGSAVTAKDFVALAGGSPKQKDKSPTNKAGSDPMNPLKILSTKTFHVHIPDKHKDLFSSGHSTPGMKKKDRRISETSSGLVHLDDSSPLQLGDAAKKLLEKGDMDTRKTMMHDAGKKSLPIGSGNDPPMRMSIGVAQRVSQKKPEEMASKQKQRSSEV